MSAVSQGSQEGTVGPETDSGCPEAHFWAFSLKENCRVLDSFCIFPASSGAHVDPPVR